jgi:hypothetical protein
MQFVTWNKLNPHGWQRAEKYKKLDKNIGFAEATT